MRALLAVAALGEAVTGLFLLVRPQLVGRLLLGTDLAGVAEVAGRVLGIALLALAVACRPGGGPGAALGGMLTYCLLTATYLAYTGVRGEWVGPLLWPAVVLHLLLTLALAWAWRAARRPLAAQQRTSLGQQRE